MIHAGFSHLSYSKDDRIFAAVPSERQARIPKIPRLLQDETQTADSKDLG